MPTVKCQNCGLSMQVPAGGRRLCGCGSWLASDDEEEAIEAVPVDAAESWPRAERTIAKVEVTQGKLNPRFVVTDLAAADGFTPATVYAFYCQRGDAPENRIKEFKVDLAADRLSCQDFRANQFRLILHVAAYMLIQTMQEALAGTALFSRGSWC